MAWPIEDLIFNACALTLHLIAGVVDEERGGEIELNFKKKTLGMLRELHRKDGDSIED